MKAVICVGASGSGKSTFAEALVKSEGNERYGHGYWVEVNRDDVRFEHYAHQNGTRDWTAYKFTKAREKHVTEVCNETIRLAEERSENIVCSDTNLNPKTRNEMIKKLEDFGYEVNVMNFPCALETLYKRNAQRFGGIPNDIVYKQYLQWLDYTDAKRYKRDNRLERAVVFDIDGTLAQMHSRGPFDWMRVGEDHVRQDIADMLDGYLVTNYRIIIATGRDGICEDITKTWLDVNDIHYDDFYIRPEGNTEKDFVIKERMLWEMAKKWDIAAWVDDRPAVHRHLRLLGVNMICVGDPYLEF
jgi:predicted kinase